MISPPLSVDDYIRQFPPPVQAILQKIRQIIRSCAPLARESIAYQMPAYTVNGKPLIYFAAYKHHIGLYATPSGHAAFASELAGYKQGKGSVQFPLSQTIPLDLIRKIVIFRATECEK
jgi:uncharacterized protein YdhG (YjbR/CyaY superfamily)